MRNQIEALRQVLRRGIALSKQGSYARRSPQPEAIPLFEAARDGLRTLAKQSPANADIWRLLSQAEECLLNYQAAISCFEKALRLSDARSNKDSKRLALLKQSFNEWNTLPLSTDELSMLGRFLEESGAVEEANGRTLEFTTQWLRQNGFNVEAVANALASKGAFTDFQVFHNLVRG